MPRWTKHARLLPIPQTETLQGGRLEAIHDHYQRGRQQLIFDYRGFTPTEPTTIAMRDHRVIESGKGYLHPYRLRFNSLRWIRRTGLFENLDHLAMDHDVRSLRGMLHWNPPQAENRYLLIHGSDDPARLMFSASRCEIETRDDQPEAIEYERDWSPAPAFPVRLISNSQRFQKRYAGDPIRIQVDGKMHESRLLIGALEDQTQGRPNVDVVLNLGEEPNPWSHTETLADPDRWTVHGEGRVGMSVATIRAEAQWVIDHLRMGRRVLVHCVAGMNRSATICCAIVMLLEGVSATVALERVRERHPWARPDSYHWLKLRWLEQHV